MRFEDVCIVIPPEDWDKSWVRTFNKIEDRMITVLAKLLVWAYMIGTWEIIILLAMNIYAIVKLL